MSPSDHVRIGFIGAGAIARTRHLPGLAKILGVELVAVSNRSRASGAAIASQWKIPQIIDDWHDLITSSSIDAVFIGTWPYMHREMSVAALGAGKHVFCQARMAMDLAEAKTMLAAANTHPNQVAHICPPPTRMPFEPYVRRVMETDQLGQIVSVEMLSHSGANLNLNAVHWRERQEFSGKQVLTMGIYAETLNAWVGPYERLSAQTAVFVDAKHDESGKEVRIKVPQAVTIAGRLRCGALAVENHLGLAADKTTPGDRLTIWGRKGTLRYTFGDKIELAAAGEPLAAVNVPDDLKRGWRVEEDFIQAVRNARAGKSHRVGINPDFSEGLDYMRKVEAIQVSASTGRAVKLSEL